MSLSRLLRQASSIVDRDSGEDDYSWTNAHASANDLPPFRATTTNEMHEKWLDALRGRVGYAFDRFLVYGTAGAALAGTEVLVSNPAIGTFVDRRSRSSWVAGVGGGWLAWSASWVDVSFNVEIPARRLRIGEVFRFIRQTVQFSIR